ncbi:MAG: Gfo/Idh/MocA family protein [Ardenticatenaceae bacterium]
MKIGMFSFAHMHAFSYVSCLQKLPDVEVSGIYDDDIERGQEMAAQFGVPFFEDAQALLDIGLDGVIICSENAKHRPMVELAAGQTGYILCEKPIATTLADAQFMIDICAERGSKLQIAYPVRFSPPIQRMKQAIEQGTLGRILSAKCTNHGSMPGRWFIVPELAGGGAVIDHTVHVIDVLRWFWQTEVTEVYAEVGDNLLHPELGTDDAGLLSFKLANGVYGTLDTSWSRPDSYPTWGDVKIELLGEKGLMQVDAFRQDLSVSSEKWGKTQWLGWGSSPDRGLIKDFTDMIREARPPSITGRDGLKSLEVALAAYESARSGKVVRLD